MIKLPHDVLGDLHIPYGQVYCFQNIHAFLCGISDIQADAVGTPVRSLAITSG